MRTGGRKGESTSALSLGRRDVLHREDLFARLDEPQFPPGQILDRRGIVAQPLHFLTKPGILRPETRERLLLDARLLTRLHHRDEALVADNGVEQQDAS